MSINLSVRGRPVFLAYFAAAALGLFLSSPAVATTWCVNPSNSSCKSTIGAAIADAVAGDTIQIFPGTYKEEVTITIPLTLQGSSYHGRQAIIDATGLPHAIFVLGVTSGAVTIEQLVAENAQREGILIEDSSQVTVTQNVVANNDQALILTAPCPGTGECCPGGFPFDQDDCGEGLHLMGVTNSAVLDNIVENNQGGILLTDETGPNHDNLIEGNLSQNNLTDCGITMPSHPPCGAGTTDLTGCIGGPEVGTPSPGVFNNIVTHNISRGNGASGVGIFAPTPGTSSSNNFVIDNFALNNAQGGVVLHSHAPAQNLNNNAIIGNFISGNGGDPDSEGGSSPPPVGIVLFSDVTGGANPLVGEVVTQNTITNETNDIFVGTTAIDVSLLLNNLLGGNGVIGVDNAGTGSVNAIEDYWGCPQGPGAGGCSGISGTVISAPFLTQQFDQSSFPGGQQGGYGGPGGDNHDGDHQKR